MKQVLFIGLAALALAACATKYSDSGLTGGIEVTTLDERTLEIEGRGNRFTKPEVIADYVFLRAAEETLRLGFDYFQVLDDDNRVEQETVVSADVTTSTPIGTADTFRGVKLSTYRLEESVAKGPTFIFERASSRIVVRLYQGELPEERAGNIFSAQAVLDELGPLYLK